MQRPSTAAARMKDDEAELARLEQEREDAVAPPEEAPEPTKPEEKMWKKRHDDGRRYMEKLKADHDAEIKKLQGTVESMRGQIRRSDALPKTVEEVEKYALENPETMALLTSVITRELNEREDEVNEKFARLETAKVQTDEEIAKRKLESMHDGSDNLPTYAELEADEAFHLWVSDQSDTFSKALYENAADWKSAHSVIEAYKNTLRVKAKSGKRGKKPGAADAVTPSTPPVTPAGDTSGFTFSESQIKAMSDEEFESQSEEIAAAGQAGKILLDITG